MMEKYKNMNELNLKIKTIEGSICQLQVSQLYNCIIYHLLLTNLFYQFFVLHIHPYNQLSYNSINSFTFYSLIHFSHQFINFQELISIQMPYYNKVIIEKKMEEDRIWQEKLYVIQRKIAVRKIQMHFRRYLNYIKTRDIKKNKKGQHKKLQSKIQKTV